MFSITSFGLTNVKFPEGSNAIRRNVEMTMNIALWEILVEMLLTPVFSESMGYACYHGNKKRTLMFE